MENRLQQVMAAISRPDERVMEEAANRWDILTKPPGSLGKLERVGMQLSGIQGTVFPSVAKRAVVVMCGDHGVTEEGVSAFPSAVTGLMMQNFCRGGAAINVLSRQMGAEVHVVDIGSATEVKDAQIVQKNVRRGTANMAQGPAMTREEAVRALLAGIEIAEQLKRDGVQVIALGEMGIGNTTPSSALAAVLTGVPLEQLVGRGTGIADEAILHKRDVIRCAIALNQPDADDALDVLVKVGGLEIAGLAGVVLGAASGRVAVLVDGVIAAAAALVAVRLAPDAREYLFPSHLSQEPAHEVLLSAMDLAPILHVDMRLGEGTGAVLAMPFLEAATRLVAEMATFADIGM